MHGDMKRRVAAGEGFVAALDQSGGSTPSALDAYGIPDSAYDNEEGMFALMHEMRVRVMTAPAFTSDRLVAAILFERTMDGKVGDVPVPTHLWQARGIVPFLKVDKGLEPEADGVRLMKPIPDLEGLLDRATGLGVFGTKMRSVVGLASTTGIAAIVEQQFHIAEQISDRGLMPIIEPEVLVTSPEKGAAETLLVAELGRRLDTLPKGVEVMLKVTIPDVPDIYAGLARHPRVVRVLALSGGYDRPEACSRLARNHDMIASFSRALLNGLNVAMDDVTFDAALRAAIDEIFRASTSKRSGGSVRA